MIKTQPLAKIASTIETNPQDILDDKDKFCQDFAKEQVNLTQCFGKSYIVARFPKVVLKNGDYIFLTHEKKRTDIYPSENHPNITNLCFLSFRYFGMNTGDIDEKNKSFVIGAIGQNSSYISDYNNDRIKDLVQKIEKPENKESLTKYLEGVEKYAKMGYRLDLVGKDNVIMNSDGGKSEIVVNNSAAKMESINTFEENLTKITNGKDKNEYSRREIVEFMNQIAGIVNINTLCDLVGKPKIYTFEQKTNELIKQVLDSWKDLYVEKK